MVKTLWRRLVRWMVARELKAHGLVECAMCDGLAALNHGTCDYCDYELDMMAKQSYEEVVLG